MNYKKISPEEQFNLILECRRSGMTDHQWLEEHDISPSTFYSWITKFRKKGYPNIPEPSMQHMPQMVHPQEVVKLNITPEPLEQDAPINTNYSNNEHAIEIAYGNAVIRLNNGADPHLVELVLRSLGGVQ